MIKINGESYNERGRRKPSKRNKQHNIICYEACFHVTAFGIHQLIIKVINTYENLWLYNRRGDLSRAMFDIGPPVIVFLYISIFKL
jgi:hypothetical protein